MLLWKWISREKNEMRGEWMISLPLIFTCVESIINLKVEFLLKQTKKAQKNIFNRKAWSGGRKNLECVSCALTE